VGKVASAPARAFDPEGGEQPETNGQSVTYANSIRPSLSGRLLAMSEPLTV